MTVPILLSTDRFASILAVHATPATEFRLNDDVRPIEQSDYSHALQELVDLVSPMPGINNIYSFGQIRAPGISDLDALIVLEAPAISMVKQSFSKLNSRIFLHDPFLVPEEMIIEFARIFPMTNLARVEYPGAVLKEDRTFSNQLPSDQEVLTAVDFYLSVFCKSFAWILISGRCDARSTLLLLRNLWHSLSRISRLSGHMPREWESYGARVASLRNSWTGTDLAEKGPEIYELCKIALRHSYELGETLARHLLTLEYTTPLQDENLAFIYGRLSLIFTDESDPYKRLENELKMGRETRRLYSFVPRIFSQVIADYCSVPGPYTKHLEFAVGQKHSATAARLEEAAFRSSVLNRLFETYREQGYFRRSSLSYYDFYGGSPALMLLYTSINLMVRAQRKWIIRSWTDR